MKLSDFANERQSSKKGQPLERNGTFYGPESELSNLLGNKTDRTNLSTMSEHM